MLLILLLLCLASLSSQARLNFENMGISCDNLLKRKYNYNDQPFNSAYVMPRTFFPYFCMLKKQAKLYRDEDFL